MRSIGALLLFRVFIASCVISRRKVGAVVPEALRCPGPWPDIQERIRAVLDADVQPDAARIAAVVVRAPLEDSGGVCILGQISIQVGEMLVEPITASHFEDTIHNIWQILLTIGWVAVLRSGWPIFQLLAALSRHVEASRGEGAVPRTEGEEDRKYIALLLRHLSNRLLPTDAGLTSSSLAYVAAAGRNCPLTLAAAMVAITWGRLPVFDGDSEALLRLAEGRALQFDVMAMFFTDHPFLAMLGNLARACQLPLHSVSEEASIGPSHRMVSDVDAASRRSDWLASGESAARGECVVPSARTPSGRCNFFAPIEQGLAIWRRRQGVFLEDVVRAFRPVTDQKTLLLRLVGDRLLLVTPRHSHLEADFGATEPSCIANAVLSVLARADLPDFDMVLNHGDLPILRKRAGKPPFYGPTDREERIPAPLFSICSSGDFWDLLFPNVCRPALVNMSTMSQVPWASKREVGFWRGTDRGAVNWAIELRDMYRGSPRKRFLDKWEDTGLFDLAFLEDDLLNATVVNTDPSFVPLDRWLEWRYLLDLPGNGYSGSLKQKLTSSSAVLLLTDVDVPGASPVYEHYHMGLQDLVHVLHVSMEDAGKRLQWARSNDGAMREMVRRANEYMARFEELTQCYIWRLIDRYARLLRYTPSAGQLAAFGSGTSVRILEVHRRPLRREAAAFRTRCLQLLQEEAA